VFNFQVEKEDDSQRTSPETIAEKLDLPMTIDGCSGSRPISPFLTDSMEAPTRVKFRPFYTLSEDTADCENHSVIVPSPLNPMTTVAEVPSQATLLGVQRVNSEGKIIGGFGEEADQVLSKVEILMKGDLYNLSLFWKANSQQVLTVLRHAHTR
jgi:hypothetical protein